VNSVTKTIIAAVLILLFSSGLIQTLWPSLMPDIGHSAKAFRQSLTDYLGSGPTKGDLIICVVIYLSAKIASRKKSQES